MPDFAALLHRKNADVISHLATHTVSAEGGLGFRGIFLREYAESNGIEGMRPVVTCSARDACGVQHVDRLVVGRDLYRVIGLEPDGTGLVRIILEFLE